MAARAKTLLLLLAACCLPAFAHVPRAPLVVQKPHQGVERFVQASQRGPGAANALTAPGFCECLYDEGGRSRSTAKERDDESGLDYFGARYMSASLGRFTSADAPFIDQHTSNPQSWNLYSYVRNNPHAYVDTDGRAILKAIKLLYEGGKSVYEGASFVAGVAQDVETVKQGFGPTATEQQQRDAALAIGGYVPVLGDAIDIYDLGAAAVATGAALIGGDGEIQLINEPDDTLKTAPNTPENRERMNQGRGPIGNDGNTVELHHVDQKPGEIVPMTQEDHRTGPNYRANHPNGNSQPSQIDRQAAGRQRRGFWRAVGELLKGLDEE